MEHQCSHRVRLHHNIIKVHSNNYSLYMCSKKKQVQQCHCRIALNYKLIFKVLLMKLDIRCVNTSTYLAKNIDQSCANAVPLIGQSNISH